MIEQPIVNKIIQGLTAVLVLLVLILTGVRLLLTDAFVRFEYNQKNFPADTYGMTQEERLRYAPIALEFLLNNADASFLGDLRFDDGSVMYNERELSHMVDVQVLTQIFLKVWYGCLILLAVIWVWAWRGKWLDRFRQMLSFGGLSTLVVLGTLILLLLLSFDLVFVGFHRIFFQGNSWLFLFSDTLIRLFPEKFWQDAFILVGVFSLLGGLLLWLGFRRKPAAG
jgi:integral membrane protein (TIGR01906 family)